MKSNRLSLYLSILVLVTFPMANNRTNADTTFAFSVDSFQVTGNLPHNVIDEFDDNILDPWQIQDAGTVVESDGIVTLSSPGAPLPFLIGHLRIVNNRSSIESLSSGPFGVLDGSGAFSATSIWHPDIPALNQDFNMGLDYITLGFANFEPIFADALSIPSGPVIFFTQDNDDPSGAGSIQATSVVDQPITDSIILQIHFDDTSNLFSASFSLDGGVSFETPFTPLYSLGLNRFDLAGESYSVSLSCDFCGVNFLPADGYVDVWDLMYFADCWHCRSGDPCWDDSSTRCSICDLAGPNFVDPDGYIDVWDLMTFADNWHTGQQP